MVACDLQDVGKLCGTGRERALAIWREIEKQRRREVETARELLGMGWRGRVHLMWQSLSGSIPFHVI